jgi:hypothetical protein
MKGGEEFNMKGNDGRDAAKWNTAIQARMDWLRSEREMVEAAKATMTESDSSNPRPKMIKHSGWLMKKSPHKYRGMQVIFQFLKELFVLRSAL